MVILIAFNRLIDPYGLYETPRIHGVNVNKPALNSHLRMSKVEAVKRQKPLSIILGTSRAEFGLGPEHPMLDYPSYNFSIPNTRIYEAYRHIQHAQAVQPLKKVVLMLDFFMFNAVDSKTEIDFEESRLAVDSMNNPQFKIFNDKIMSLVSLDTVVWGIKTIMKQHDTDYRNRYNNGSIDQKRNMDIIMNNGKKSDGGGINKAFFPKGEDFYWNKSHKNTLFSFDSPTYDTLKIFYDMLLFSHKNDIDLRIAINPIHAYLFEKIAYQQGYMKLIEEWKKQLVKANEGVANQLNVKPFPLWDFSGFNLFTTEAVPPEEDRMGMMQWYFEDSHYKKELGDIILDRILDYQHIRSYNSSNFGVLITSDNIDKHLQTIQVNRKEWKDMVYSN
jgi:hypothetical protein